MHYLKHTLFLLAATVAFTTQAESPKNKRKFGVYLAGVSASFSDSIVYFTDIQHVDSASLGSKGLLEGRAQYSIQLKDYIESREHGHNRTCFVYYSSKKKNLQKEISKLKEKYQKSNTLVIKNVDPEFRFKKAELY